MYRELIAIPSVSCLDPSWDTSNKAIIEKLAGWLDLLGFQVAIHALKQPGKYNLLARYEPVGAHRGGLLLSGHTDTVPWDEGRCTQDQFKLHEADGRLYVLGISDMKGFHVFVLKALRHIDLHHITKPLYIPATANEENKLARARALI